MATSKAHIKATTKFEHKNYDKITLRLRKDGDFTRDTIQEAANSAGKSLNGYIIEVLKDKIKKN